MLTKEIVIIMLQLANRMRRQYADASRSEFHENGEHTNWQLTEMDRHFLQSLGIQSDQKEYTGYCDFWIR